jgi:hypothetical protein
MSTILFNFDPGMVIPIRDEATESLGNATRWGLPPEAIADAWAYLQGLMLMKTGRNFANMDRRVSTPDGDGQGLQQFMSDLPWAAQSAIQQVQCEISATPALQHGGVLLPDESPDEKAGAQSAGAGRQQRRARGPT